MHKTNSYEVMDFIEDHWTITFITDNRDEALNEAKNHTCSKHTKAVSVVQEITDLDLDKAVTTVIYQEGIAGGVPYPINENKPYTRPAGQKPRALANDDAGPAETSVHGPHPAEKVTGLIDQFRRATLMFGGISLGLIFMLWFYLSNPEIILSLIDTLLSP